MVIAQYCDFSNRYTKCVILNISSLFMMKTLLFKDVDVVTYFLNVGVESISLTM